MQKGQRGFALIITITLLAFLVMLLVSLAALTRVETQVASNNQQLSGARQNALFGLTVALGRLQQLTGPDQRVTATADMVESRDDSKKNWTGVWNSDAAHADYGKNIGWLVSGVATAGNAPIEGGLTASTNNSLVSLVGTNTAGTEAPENLVQVLTEPIKASNIPGMSGEMTVGQFAYWVGDEGVKANAGLVDPWIGSANLAERRYSFINMQRSGVELVNASAGQEIGEAYVSNSPLLSRVVSLEQLALTEPAFGARWVDAARNRFHDLTPFSASLHADVAKGGLKKDLTNWITFGAPTGAIEQDSAAIVTTSENTAVGMPKWGLLRSFATTRDDGQALAPVEQTDTQNGLSPVLTYFRLGINISARADEPMKIHLFPRVVLWNPNSVPLAHVDPATGDPVVYQVAWRVNATRNLHFTPVANPATANRTTLPLHDAAFYIFDIVLSEPMPPGQSLVFTLRESADPGLDTVPYVAGGGTVLVNKLDDGTSAVIDGKTYTEADLAGGMRWSISNAAGDTMHLLLRKKPATAVVPVGTGQVAGEYFAARRIGLGGFSGVGILSSQASLENGALEPGFAFTMYTRMTGSTSSTFRWIANQNYRARFSPRTTQDGTNHSIYFGEGKGPVAPPLFAADAPRASAGITVSGATARDLVLSEVPPADAVLTSLAQFQHANLSLISQYPAYAAGNAIASPYIALGDTEAAVSNANDYTRLHDISYLLNRDLWDRYYFSTVPDTLDATNIADSGYSLPNARNVILRSSDNPDVVALRGSAAFDTAAAHLMLKGGFNVNSTSRQAWRAFLAGHLGEETSGNRHAFSRFIKPIGGVNEVWEGHRNLSDAQIKELADHIADEVLARGPFLSLADFVNRRLTARGRDTSDAQRYKGTLQAALDNTDTGTTAPINTPLADSVTGTRVFEQNIVGNTPLESSDQPQFQGGATKRAPYSSRSAFAPGYLTQADLLTAIGPALTARSDTFRIRAYGNVINPATGATEGRAWCEALVQRLPEYVEATATPAWQTPAVGGNNEKFGRRYKIISFRWLTSTDI